MHVGTVFPQTEIGTDVETIREYATTVESLGYDHIQAYDHVLGADPDRPGWSGTYDYAHQFHEPLALFAYLAGLTESVTLLTGILILPQRQTALVAKQAAEVDVLSRGRLELGVGVGWNELEYEALGESFETRGDRIEEQIEVLRRLWQEEIVEFDGEWHRLPAVGINPLPIQQPLPVWMGGDSDVVLRRTARVADGWLAQDEPPGAVGEKLDRLRDYLRREGRDPDEFGVQVRMALDPGAPESWIDEVRAWRDLGATHLTVDSMEMGLEDPGDHIDLVRRFKTRLDDAGV